MLSYCTIKETDKGIGNANPFFFLFRKSRINIYFTFQGFLDPMPFDFIQPLIAKKEEKLLTYKEKNPNIDEMWLCIFLPDEEFGFTIKGLECPMGYKSNYKRIILVQNTPPFVRDL